MLVHPVFHKISIDMYRQEILTIFMLEDGFNVTFTLNRVRVEDIAYIQHWLSTEKKTPHKKKTARNIANI